MNTEPLLYRLTPADPAGHCFLIQLRIAQPDANGQAFSLPSWIPGSYLLRDFSRQIQDIRASDEHNTPVAIIKAGTHSWQCAPCTGALHIEYRVYAWDLSVRNAHFDETHAFFNGTSVFLYPHGQTDLPCLLEINPPPHTKKWKVFTSLPEANPKQYALAAKRHGFGLYEAPDYDALIDHPVELGTPQVVSFQAHGAEHEMVFTGEISGLDMKRIAADAKKICETQIALFEPETMAVPFLDSASRYVFMTMVTGNAYGGLEHRASTALMISRNDLPVVSQSKAPEGYTTFLGLVSHEYFHTWNIKRIKPAAFAPYNLLQENHTRLLWVAEGFTSYYDDLMLLRSGTIDETQYFSLLEKTIGLVMRSPGRHRQSIADSSYDAWTRFYKQDEESPNAIVSYYSKGALAAWGLDLLLRRETMGSRSLDDVMRLLWQQYGKTFYAGVQKGIEEDAMASLIQQATGVDVSDYLSRYVYGCDDVPLADLLADQGVTLACEKSRALPSLDVRTKHSGDQLTLATVYKDGAGHLGGLSAGDILVAINGLRITDAASLDQAMRLCRPGQSVPIHVFRRDELRVFKVKVSPPPNDKWTLKRTHDAVTGH
ncbi:MAG TPA: peptidase M61 [Pusillimonas sp.]|jgi:predicted metalloprotease with PDZ domain|nr:peptidase M61 [Pusillimonas sp.]|tara:strand:- start:7868 stop:9664 length:1797 start_codon:yes stop_codon:yes gene_type:complete